MRRDVPRGTTRAAGALFALLLCASSADAFGIEFVHGDEGVIIDYPDFPIDTPVVVPFEPGARVPGSRGPGPRVPEPSAALVFAAGLLVARRALRRRR